MFKFLCYHAFRKKKPRGRKKKDKICEVFGKDEFNIVMENFQSMSSNNDDRPPDPVDGIDNSSMVTHRAAVRQILERQINQGINVNTVSHVFDNVAIKELMHMVLTQRPRQNKKNHVKKIDHQSSVMDTTQYVKDIEAYFWNRDTPSNCHTHTLFASLRDRFVYLYTEKGIVRGKSVFKAKLSDLFGIVVKRENIDPHPFYCDIMTIATGKTNKGMKLYGRVGRHKNVLQCPIGAKCFIF